MKSLALLSLVATAAAAAGQEVHSLVGANPTTNAFAGIALESGDGLVFSGAYQAPGAQVWDGAVFTFDPVSGTQVGTLFNPSGQNGDWFGAALAFDNGELLVGAHGEDYGGALSAGRAHLIDVASGQIVQSFEDPSPVDNGFFGQSLALGEGVAVIRRMRIADGGYWLHAFDTSTGALMWSEVHPWLAEEFGATLAISSGKVYTVLGNYPGSQGNGAMAVHDLATGAPLADFEVPGAARLDSNDEFLAVSCHANPVRIYDTGNSTFLGELPLTTGYTAYGAPLDLEGDRLVYSELSSPNVGIFHYDLESDQLIGEAIVPEDDSDPHSLAVSGALVVRGATYYDAPGTTSAGRAVVHALGIDTTTSYCTAAPNSTGQTGKLQGGGSSYTGPNAFWLRAWDLPADQFVLFVNGPQQGFVMNPGGSDGNLCLGGPLGRHKADLNRSSAAGAIAITIDLGGLPRPDIAPDTYAVQPGETWNFQAWHRDGASSNFTEGATITFQ